LADLGLDTHRDFGVDIAQRLVLGTGGEILAKRACLQTATSWNRLFAMLAAAFGATRYHLGKDLRFDTDAERTSAAVYADPQRMLAETARLDFLGAPQSAD